MSEEQKKKIFIKKPSATPFKIRLKNPNHSGGQEENQKRPSKGYEKREDQKKTYPDRNSFSKDKPNHFQRPYAPKWQNDHKSNNGGAFSKKDNGDDKKKTYQGNKNNQKPNFENDTNLKKNFFVGNSNKRVGKIDFKKKREFTKEEQAEINFELQKKKTMGYAIIPKKIEINETILVNDLAQKMNLKSGKLIQKLMELGYMATINDALDAETAEIVASEFDCHVVIKSRYEELENYLEALDDKTVVLEERPPIVTIMGHVDHGKTTLLDYIRKSHVTKTEAGGITQYVGAYQIEHHGKKITFIDTPGHEAFTKMRGRGALITDIVILVVAADDGVMPQTIEALNHAKAAHVPIIVAINKIDKESKNIDTIKSMLSEQGLVPEDWGGETFYIGVSAISGQGVDSLLETILLIAEMKEYKAGKNKLGKGVILESKVDKSRGSGATVIMKDGSFKRGDIVLVGTSVSRIRAMFDHNGVEIEEALPSTPFEILGFDEIPEAGDMIHATKTEKIAREIIEKRKEIRQIELAKKIKKADTSLDGLYSRIQEQGKLDFNIIIKSDVQGTAEAIKGIIENLANKIEEINLKVIHSAVGAITESDIMLASTSKALIIGFNVRVNNDKANALVKEKAVEIRRYSIIYEITEDLQDAIEGVLEPEQQDNILGEALVKQIFKISKVGTIAGSVVTSGTIKINASVRVIRDGVVLTTSKITTLKRFKDEIKEATKGSECGIAVQNFQDLKEGDIFEAFEIVKVARKLKLKN